MKLNQYFSFILSILIISIFSWAFYTSSGFFLQKEKQQKTYTIGLLVMATGQQYLEAAKRMIESAQVHFCKNHKVNYFVFTDSTIDLPRNTVTLYQKQMGWPYDSIMRFATYHKYRDHFKECDYLFSCDADMLFVDDVDDEILGDLVATIHPQVRFRPRGYEHNPISTAHMHRAHGTHYFAGAFYGGTQKEFLKLISIAQENINIDLARGYIARVNDESHLNHYFAYNRPKIILGPEYCHFEHWKSPYKPKLVALSSLDVNKRFMRKKASYNPLEYYVNLLKSEFDANSSNRI